MGSLAVVSRMYRCGWLPAVVGAMLLAGDAAGQAVKYTQPVVVPTTQFPYSPAPVWAKSFVVGDLDGDGKLDFLYQFPGAQLYTGTTLDFPLFNAGGGTFLQPQAGTGTGFLQKLGDSVVQAIAPVTKGGRAVQIEVGIQSGAAAVTAIPYTTSRSVDLASQKVSRFTMSGNKPSVTAVAVADLNGDGANDVVVLDGPNGILYELFNDGTGEFTAKTFVTEPEACSQLLVDDFDLDGIPDIATLGADGRIFVALSDGHGGTKATRVYTIPEGSAYSMLYADLNGDGLKDLVVEGLFGNPWVITATAGYGPDDRVGAVELLTNNGGMTNEVGGHLIGVADLNGDGIADIVTSTPAGVYVLLGQGSLTYKPSLPYNVGPGRTSYALADFNGDGKLDLAVDSPEGIAILYGLGNGSFEAGPTFDTYHPGSSLVLGDFRGKGVLDAAVSYGIAQVSYLQGDGTGNFLLTEDGGGATAGPSTWSHVVAGDFDGDGNLDIATSADGPVEMDLGLCCNYPARDNGMFVTYGVGNGTFGPPVAQGPTNSGAHYGMLLAADLNGDGVTDLVNFDANEAGGYDGAVGYRLGDPLIHVFGVWNDGYLRPYQQIATGYLTKGRTSAPDVVVESLGSSLSFSVQKNDGKGTFSLGQQVFALPADVAVMQLGSSLLPVTGLYPSQLLLTDFDGDGNGDFLVLYHNLAADPTQPDASTANLLYIFWGNGDGTFDPMPEIVSLSRNYYQMQVADVNGDAIPDLVMSDGYLVSVLAGNGTREGFAKETHYLAGMGINAIAVASVTGPGSSDIVVADGGAVLTAGVVNRGILALNGEVNTGGLTVLPGSAGTMALGSVTGTVVAVPNPTPYDSGFTITATLTGASGGAVPTGTVDFSVGSTVECTAVVVMNGRAVCSPTSAQLMLLNAGTYTLTASYSGDGKYGPTTLTGATPLVVTPIPTTTTLIDLATPIFYGQIIADVAVEEVSPTPDNGTLDFLINGTVTCVLPFPFKTGPDAPSCYKQGTGLQQPSGAPYPVGTYTVQSVYSGDTNYVASSTPVYTVVVQPDPTSATLTANTGTSSTVGQAVTFTATIADIYATAQGTVDFFDGGAQIGTGTVNAQGQASFTTAALAVGTHNLTACLVASLDFLASSPCGSLTFTVNPVVVPPPPPPPPAGTFTLAVNPAALSIGVGNSLTAQVVVTALNGYSQPVQLACSGLPHETRCTFVQSLIGVGGGSTGMIVSPAAPHNCGSSTPDFVAPNVKSGLAGLALSVVALFGLRRRRRVVKALVLLVGAFCVLPMLGGCGSGCKDFGTEPTNYTFTVTATSTGSPVTVLTQTVALKVHL